MNREPHIPSNRRGILRTLGLPVLGLVALVLVGRWAGDSWPQIEETVAGMGAAGYVIFCGAWALLSCACFPVSVLGISGGLLFGPWLGLLLVAFGGLVGGSLMFGLARGVLRHRIRDLITTRPRLAAIDRMAGREAAKLNVLTRLSPLNFGFASYTLASGPSSYRAYLLGLVATLPSMAVQVWIGTLARRAGAGEDGPGTGRLLLLAVGVVFFAVLTWQIGRMVRRAWKEIDVEDESDGLRGR